MGNVCSRSPTNLEKLQKTLEEIDEEEKSYVSLHGKKKFWKDTLAYGSGLNTLISVFMFLQYQWALISGTTCTILFFSFCVFQYFANLIVSAILEFYLSNTTSKIFELKKRKEELMDVVLRSHPQGEFNFVRGGDGKPALVLKPFERGRYLQQANMELGKGMQQCFPRRNLFCRECSRPLFDSFNRWESPEMKNPRVEEFEDRK